jgi:putative transposase
LTHDGRRSHRATSTWPCAALPGCVRGHPRVLCTQYRQAQDHSGFLPAGPGIGDSPTMISIAAAGTSTRRTYDHRLREHVVRAGARALGHGISIPRSTVSTWQRRGLRPVVTIELLEQNREQLLETIAKLDRRARVLAAVVRLLLALLRVSKFNLGGRRLPEGAAKADILRSIDSAQPWLALGVILRVLGLEPARYHAWRHASAACALDDRPSCPRTSPGQLTAAEVAAVKSMVLSPERRHMPLRTLALYAQRVGKVFASVTTWAKLIREHGWRRPRHRLHPPKPTVGVRATQPNEAWHVDTTVIRLIDGTRAYIHGAIDNFSRKILAWTVAARLEPTSTCQVLLAASKHLVSAGRPVLYADSGIENVNGVVDATLLSACLERVLAQVEVTFSNSMIEAFWRSLKHQWLYLNALDSVERLRPLVAFYVDQHNTQMPHAAFSGQTPDEMYFGTAANLPTELAVTRQLARTARLATNRGFSCERCQSEQVIAPESNIPP